MEGQSGMPGLAGPMGEVGPLGPLGPQGIQGIQGIDGPKGDQGIQGIQGQEGGPTGPTGPSSLPNTISQFVGLGIDVTLGNLNVRISDTGNKSLMVSAVTGTYSIYGNCTYIASGQSWAEIKSTAQLSVSSTPVYLCNYHNFIVGGNTCHWYIMDTIAMVAWRLMLILGDGYVNNLIRIEQL